MLVRLATFGELPLAVGGLVLSRESAGADALSVQVVGNQLPWHLTCDLGGANQEGLG